MYAYSAWLVYFLKYSENHIIILSIGFQHTFIKIEKTEKTPGPYACTYSCYSYASIQKNLGTIGWSKMVPLECTYSMFITAVKNKIEAPINKAPTLEFANIINAGAI
jgi:hypothetical protein